MKSKKEFWKFLISLYKPVKMLTFIMCLSMILDAIIDIMKMYIIKGIVDIPTSPTFQITDLYKVGFIVITLVVLQILFSYIGNIVRTVTIVRKQDPYVAEKLFNHLRNKSYAFFTDNYSGKIQTAINQTIDLMYTLNQEVAKKFLYMLALMVSNLIAIYVIDFKLFIVATILFAGIIITRLIFFSIKYLPLAGKSQECEKDFSGILNDSILNFTTLRIYNAIPIFSKIQKNKKEESARYKNKASSIEFGYGVIANVIYIITFTALIFYAIDLYKIATITLGEFVFFINSMITIKSTTTEFTWVYIHIGETIVKLKNNYNLLYDDNNIKDDCKEKITVDEGNIEFDNITFAYNSKNVFENFNLNIENKQKIGIMGVSGSGKTTLVNLLFKFYKPQSGKILIDGKDINKYSTESLYSQITYVPQETILLHSTIYENIKIAKPDSSKEEIIAATQKAELHDFIESLEYGYETIVGERGIKLSGGQRQRIALARIFLRNSKIVVFDEATSSLDNNTEFRIQKNINKYFNNQTIICIAHRLSTLKEMDKIVVIESGNIVDSGTPGEIIPKYESRVEDIYDNI